MFEFIAADGNGRLLHHKCHQHTPCHSFEGTSGTQFLLPKKNNKKPPLQFESGSLALWCSKLWKPGN
jgi:hypothetical protein